MPCRTFAFCVALALLVSCFSGKACELCAIYGADNSLGNSSSGFLLAFSEQYIQAHHLQAEGESFSTVPFLSQAHLDSSYTHIVPGYNFSSRFGVSLNAPLIYRDYHITQFTTTGGTVDKQGTLFGLGDLALIGRVNVIQKIAMKHSINVAVLAGVKFQTGDTDQLDQEVAEARIDQEIFGKNHPHGAIGGVHQHDLTLGSGSYDGVFGVVSNFRYDRWFFNNQLQYYLRSEARGYEFGDLIIVSGGPGAYLLLKGTTTLSLQANAFYESEARDRLLDQVSNQTGMTAWYVGPLLNLNLGEHFSINAAVDIPVHIYNHGLQTVPDYRVHGGVSWRF